MYTSRIVASGMYKGRPMVSFTLASKSIPFRELKIDASLKKINVFPKKGYENHSTNSDPEVDNYSCIRVGQTNFGARYMVAFNGHMAKRTEANLLEVTNPFVSLDMTLLEFRGMKHDARIGAIAYMQPSGGFDFFLGVNDRDRGEKRICSYPNDRITNLEDRIIFIYDRDTRFEKSFELKDKTINSADKLAEHIHKNIIGEEISFGLATGIAIMDKDKFELGIYNEKIDEYKLNAWRSKLFI